jgi:protocatechuate 3,4-dioxygenase, beta subunit
MTDIWSCLMTEWWPEMRKTFPSDPVRPGLSRRSVLSWASRVCAGVGLVALSGTAARAAGPQITPGQIAGPYYPSVKPEEADWNLLSVGEGPAPDGVPLDLGGALTERSGKPIANARIEIWQSDNQGIYDHPKDKNRDRFDRRFQGFGATKTDADGRYRFLTLMPVPYPGRPPHIHVTIRRRGKGTLITQLYLKDHPENDRDGLLALMMYPGQDLLMIDPRDAKIEGGLRGKVAEFNFVVV